MKDKAGRNWKATGFLKLNLRFNWTSRMFQRAVFKPCLLFLFPNLHSAHSKIFHVPFVAVSIECFDMTMLKLNRIK